MFIEQALKNEKKTLISALLPKNGCIDCNLKRFRDVCVSTINSTTTTKFENENTATKLTVFFGPNCATAWRQLTDATDSNIN